MSRRSVVGTTYLIHFDQPLRHARHYTGWASDLDARLADHELGRGARLMAVIKAAGIGWHLARTWPGTTRARAPDQERRARGPLLPDCRSERNGEKTMTTMPGREPETAETAAAAATALAEYLGPGQQGFGQQSQPARTWTERALREAAARNRDAMRHDIERDREAGQ